VGRARKGTKRSFSVAHPPLGPVRTVNVPGTEESRVAGGVGETRKPEPATIASSYSVSSVTAPAGSFLFTPSGVPRNEPVAPFTVRFLCEPCRTAFEDRTTFTLHKAMHGPDSPWQCAKCRMLFDNAAVLLGHYSLSHPH
jgi:hypothetical protein